MGLTGAGCEVTAAGTDLSVLTRPYIQAPARNAHLARCHSMAPGLPGTGKIDQVDNLTVGPGQRRSTPGPLTATWQSGVAEKVEPAGLVAGLPA